MQPEPMLFARGEKRDLNGKEMKHEWCTHLGHFSHVTACLAPRALCILRITFLFSYWFFPKAFGPFHALLGESACYYAL